MRHHCAHARSRAAAALPASTLPALAAAFSVAAYALTGCARFATASAPRTAAEPTTVGDTTAPPDSPQADAPLAIDNRNWSDVVILVIRNDGQKVRIGMVNAATQAVLRLPANYITGSATIQLVAHPIGGWGDFRSERFTVQRGQQVTWTLESGLARSSLAVY
jgi:hypothetical protein